MNLKKLLEVAGVTEHLDAEKKIFNAAKEQLKKVCSFCNSQSGTEYKGMASKCEGLIKEMDQHLQRYEKK